MELSLSKIGMLVTGDELQMLGLGSSIEVTRFAPSVEVPPTGAPLVLRIQDATGATPSHYIEATIYPGAVLATPGTGRVPIAGNGTIFVRIVSGPTGADAASYLQGYFEAATRETGLTTFCSIADLKGFAGITVSTWDSDLTLILQGVTQSMQKYIARAIVQSLYTAERYRIAISCPRLYLREWPIVSVSLITEEATDVDSSEYVVEGKDGYLYREEGWPGRTQLLVTYTAGYDPIPSDLAHACAMQATAAWRQHAKGGGRLGESSKAGAAGGSSGYVVEEWLPEVRRILNGWKRWG